MLASREGRGNSVEHEGNKEAAGRFAEQAHRRFPDYSFAIAAKIRGGDLAPIGFESALHSRALGQHRYTRVFERCTLDEYLADDFKHHIDQP
jgi:hypothetical protein